MLPAASHRGLGVSGATDTARAPIPGWAPVIVALSFIGAVALPLATYTAALALFGLAHVLSELRYVDHRFGARLRGGLLGPLLLLIAAAALARLGGMAGWFGRGTAAMLELLAGAALLLVVLRVGEGWAARLLAGGLGLLLILGAWVAPFTALVVFAVAHNVTPMALLAERFAAPQDRAAGRPVLVAAGIALILLPLLIATGLPYDAFAALGLVDPDATLFQGGDLLQNFGAYVPSAWWEEDWALHAFSASVFAQCMHYVAVIGVLPRLIGPGDRPVLPWPTARQFGWAVLAAGGALAAGFALDYALARRIYAIAALVHAWLEIPILVLVVAALSAAARPVRARH